MGKLFDLQASGYFYSRLQNPTCDTVAAKITDCLLYTSHKPTRFLRGGMRVSRPTEHVIRSLHII